MPVIKTDFVYLTYKEYSKKAFKQALEALKVKRVVSSKERELLEILLMEIKKDATILVHSNIIYLSNGIASGVGNLLLLKKQLFFELSLRLLEAKKLNKINIEWGNCFSLSLNRRINYNFNCVEKKDEQYIFYFDKNPVFYTTKNQVSAISDGVMLLEEDYNPFNSNEIGNSHPHVEFLKYDLGTKSKKEWVNQFKEAYSLIKLKVPALYSEIKLFLHEIAPMGYFPHRQLSSSYSQSPGILNLSYTESSVLQAEAIIHEVQHTILNILESNYPLLENSREEKYYSPYRPDARHLQGCLLGLHAFVAVQNFYASFVTLGGEKFLKEFISAHLKNENMIFILKKFGKFTPAGKALFLDIVEKFENDRFLIEKYKDSAEFTLIKKEIESHLEQVKKNNSGLRY